MKRVIIVGAGYSGTLTAKHLEKKLKHEDVEIVLIDKNPFHTMLTELHEIAAARVDESSIRMDLEDIFAGRKVDIVLDTVEEIDFQKKVVKGYTDHYSYDYLVLSAGSRPCHFGIPGAEEFTYSLWSYDAAVRLNDRIRSVFRRAQATPDEEARRRLLTFWVVGAGFSGVEMISELAEYVPILCKKYGVAEEEVTLYNVDGLSRVVPNLSEKLSEKARKKLEKKGIKVYLNARVEQVTVDTITLCCGEDHITYPAGTIIWTAGTQAQEVTQKAGEILSSTRGRIQVDSYLRSMEDDAVYVVGDNMCFYPQGSKNPVPQMVENCEQSAHTAAHNLVTDITGKGRREDYKPVFHGIMVSLGSRDGVASVGLPGHMFSISGFLAIAAKHFINLIYFMQVLGWHKVATYLKAEFFTIRYRRSVMGGHLSNRTPSFFLAPLRIWVGIAWLIVGLTGSNAIFGPLEAQVGTLHTIVGAFLIAGLFTPLASLASFILFILAVDVNTANLWMIFANIALFGGAGRVFGMDYYIIPAARKWWRSLPFVQKWYLFLD